MKNKNQSCKKPLQKILDFFEGNLQAIIGLLLLLAFIFGYSIATTPEKAGEITPESQTALRQVGIQGTDTTFLFQGKTISEIKFGANGNIYGTPRQLGATWDNTKNMLTRTTYLEVTEPTTNKVTITLGKTFNGNVTVVPGPKSGFHAAVNGTTKMVNSATEFPLNASQIELTLGDLWSIRSLKTTSALTTIDPTTIPSSAAVLPTGATVPTGETTTLIPFILNLSGTNIANRVSISWTSSNKSVATVSSTGLVTGVGAGTATITLQVVGSNLSASATITVKEKADFSVSVSPSKLTLKAGESASFTISTKAIAGFDRNLGVTIVTPIGVTAEYLSTVEAGKSIKVTLKAGESVQNGDYVINPLVTDGFGLTRKASVGLTVSGGKEAAKTIEEKIAEGEIEYPGAPEDGSGKFPSLSLDEVKKALNISESKVLPQKAFNEIVKAQPTFAAKVTTAVKLTVAEVVEGTKNIAKTIGNFVVDLFTGRLGAGATLRYDFGGETD